jgi:hypothetical protein
MPMLQIERAGHMDQIRRSTLRIAIGFVVAVQGFVGAALAQDAPKTTLPYQLTTTAGSKDLIDQFIACFNAGKDPKTGGQVVLLKDAMWCDDQNHDARAAALKDTSLSDWISRDACGGQGAVDYRRMDSNLVKDIVGTKDLHLKASGIRIIGAAFCESEVDLSDIEVPYSIVLDFSLFKFGLRAQNLKIDGSFSIDNSVVFDNFVLYGAKIGQNLYATQAFIRYITLQASQVGGSVYLNGSLIANSINVLNTTIKGDLKAIGTATSDFVISTNSQVSGQLDISQSEARCSFQLQPSSVGDFVAQTAGFGQVSVDNGVDWQRAKSKTRIAKFLASPVIQKIESEYAKCPDSGDWRYVFLVSGMKTKSICLSDFQASFPQAGAAPIPGATVRITGASVADGFILDVGSDAKQARSLEMLEVDGPVFVFNFAGFPNSYERVIDGFHFKRVYAWTKSYHCGLAGKKDDWQVPETHDVIRWLQSNKSPSLQPYVTMAASFEDAGRDSTSIKVDKTWTEQKNAVRDQRAALENAWSTDSFGEFLFKDGPIIAIDYLRSGLNWIFGFLVDFGFRPAKSLLSIVAIVVIAFIFFRFGLGIFAFIPNKSDHGKFVGPIFIFDHLIPALKLSADNYDVQTYLMRPTKTTDPNTVKEVLVWNRPMKCVPADDTRTFLAERCLLVLKVLGFVLAVFLLAAINALVHR